MEEGTVELGRGAGGVNRQPLVLAAAALLAGVAAGMAGARWGISLGLVWGLAVAAWGGWAILEKTRREAMAGVCLAGAIFLAGGGVWELHQRHVEPTHVARWVPPDDREVPITLRVRVEALQAASSDHGSARFVADARQVLTENGWVPASGSVLVNWQSPGDIGGRDLVELYGWLKRPEAARNPGAIDPRRQLAEDRIFAEVRVPRTAGIVRLERGSAGEHWLARFRGFLRGKLLEHTVRQDVPAAYTLAALVLGTRDPAMGEVSRAFADAGVAHLLAISGSHIVFFAGLAWGILRMVPLRPRCRELLICAVVMGYVLATPCGPPVMRAAIALVLLVLARLIGRPREYLNMLAAAAILVVLLRPTDIRDAGCQLSFVSTAGLILLSRRLHRAWFSRWLEREGLIADLAATRAARWRIGACRLLAGLVVANAIGAMTAAPLVALHFSQVNAWAVVAGLVALPVVSAGMVAGALQLLLETLWAAAGSWFAPVSVGIGKAMIWVVAWLAALPGSAMPVRPPPGWAVALAYAVGVIWVVRRRLGISRAAVLNAGLLVLVAAAGWYAWTQPVGRLDLEILDAGSNGSCVLVRTPRGDLWMLDAGVTRGGSMEALVGPPLRMRGRRAVDGLVLTSLEARHAGGVGEVGAQARRVIVSQAQWMRRGETLAGEQLDKIAGPRVKPLKAGDRVAVGGAEVEVLWPPGEAAGPGNGLVLVWTYAGRRVLVMDPGEGGGEGEGGEAALARAIQERPGLRCDALVFLGNRRGDGDASLRRVIAPLQAKSLVWSGRGAWASRREAAGEWNSADGAVMLRVGSTGEVAVGRD